MDAQNEKRRHQKETASSEGSRKKKYPDLAEPDESRQGPRLDTVRSSRRLNIRRSNCRWASEGIFFCPKVLILLRNSIGSNVVRTY